MLSFTIVGPGRMGGALAIALIRAGYDIDALIGHKSVDSRIVREIYPPPEILLLKTTDIIKSDVVLITTPDRSIADVSSQLVGLLSSENHYVFHTSGSLSSDILHPLAAPGRNVGSIHPLVSICSPVDGAKKFAGTYFCLEGNKSAVRVGKEIVKGLGARPFFLDGGAKPLYHLAAMMSSGHLVALIDVAISLMSRTGVGSEEARSILLPLIKSTVENLESQQTTEALTGPISRGDLPVINSHLEALTGVASTNEIEIYLDLALRSLDVAERLHSTHKLQDMRNLILLAKQNIK